MYSKDCPNCSSKFIPDVDEQGNVMTGPYQMCPICEKETANHYSSYREKKMDKSLNAMDLESKG